MPKSIQSSTPSNSSLIAAGVLFACAISFSVGRQTAPAASMQPEQRLSDLVLATASANAGNVNVNASQDAENLMLACLEFQSSSDLLAYKEKQIMSYGTRISTKDKDACAGRYMLYVN